jgi:hypothetical protein
LVIDAGTPLDILRTSEQFARSALALLRPLPEEAQCLVDAQIIQLGGEWRTHRPETTGSTRSAVVNPSGQSSARYS